MLAGSPVWRTSAVFPSPIEPRQPEIVPSSLTNRNRSLLNAVVPLNACPVGFPVPPAGNEGIVTNPTLDVASFAGLTEYKVLRPVPLSEIQIGLPGAPGALGENETPQGFFRSGSWMLDSSGLTWTMLLALAGAASAKPTPR